MHNPYSGRIYLLECKKEPGGSVCSATTYGWLEKSTLHFRAEDYQKAKVLWEFPFATSDSLVSGVLIYTKGLNFEFVPVTQPTSRTDQTLESVQNLFAGNLATVEGRIWHIGFNYPATLRLFFLLLFFGIAHFESRIGKFSNSLQSGKQTNLRFIIAWWIANSGVETLLLFFTFILKGGANYGFGERYWDFLGYCGTQMQLADYCGSCAAFPFGKLWCLYPLVSFGTILGLLQWRVLRKRIKVSGWWVAIPGLTSLWLFLMPFSLTCWDCSLLQGLASGFVPFLAGAMVPIILVYTLLLGFGQWILLRKNLPLPLGWMIFPMINVFLPPIAFWLFQEGFFGSPRLMIFIPMVLMSLLLLSIADILQAWMLLKAGKRIQTAVLARGSRF